MLANRLNVLLAERDLTIKQVTQETGISRNTISNLVNNPFGNISIDTVDVLCNYLSVTPTDFFEYSPYLVKLFDSLSENGRIAILVESKPNQELKRILFNSKLKKGSEISDTILGNFHDYFFELTPEENFGELYGSIKPKFKTFIINQILKFTQEYITKTIGKGHLKDTANRRYTINISINMDSLKKHTINRNLELDIIKGEFV